MKKVLVTGATGFLGQYVVKRLENEHFEVKALGRNEEIGKKISSENIEFIKCSLEDRQGVTKACRGIDYVVHAGALSTVWGEYNSFYNTNVTGTKNVINACKENGVSRLIFISSPSIYTEAKDKLNIKECEAPKENKLNYYIETKILAEEEVKKASSDGLYTVILRPRGLFGVGDTSIIPRLIKVNGKIGIPLINNGDQLIDVTYVENVAEAIFLSIVKDNINGEVFNITNCESIRFKELLEMLFQEIDIKPNYRKVNFHLLFSLAAVLEKTHKLLNIKREPVLTRYTVCTIGNSQTLDVSKAKQLLGYKPLYSVNEGIKIYSDWWSRNND